MNGLDTKEWNPAEDRFLPHSARFEDAAELADAKAHAKAVLQQEQGLMEDPEVHSLATFTLVCTSFTEPAPSTSVSIMVQIEGNTLSTAAVSMLWLRFHGPVLP